MPHQRGCDEMMASLRHNALPAIRPYAPDHLQAHLIQISFARPMMVSVPGTVSLPPMLLESRRPKYACVGYNVRPMVAIGQHMYDLLAVSQLFPERPYSKRL